MSKFVIYTAITEGYDTLKVVPAAWRGQAEFVAFLGSTMVIPDWTVRPIYRRFKDPCRNAKIHKIMPHRFFSNADYSLWIDGSIEIKSTLPLSQWVEQYLSGYDIALFKHGIRNCIYQEGALCMELGLDSGQVINRQMQKYFEEGYPANNGLAECTVLLRRHSPAMRQFNEAWYAEIRAHSRRDQLSFNYVANKLGIKYNLLPGSVAKNRHFAKSKHAVSRHRKCKHPFFDCPDAIILSHQRSGTHFLESCLAGHPKVHKRSECVLRYKRLSPNELLNQCYRPLESFANQRDRINIAIVMYDDVKMYEELCGPLCEAKVIHLLREPLATARSFAQWLANKDQYGEKAQAHYHVEEARPPDAAYDLTRIGELQAKIKSDQERYRTQLAGHKNVLTLHYEELTGNLQASHIPEKIAQKTLAFLGLDFHPLTTRLQKTGKLNQPATPLPL